VYGCSVGVLFPGIIVACGVALLRGASDVTIIDHFVR